MEKYISESKRASRYFLFLLTSLIFSSVAVDAQLCPVSGTTNVSSYPNTYYPATTANIPVGTKTIALGATTYGSTPITAGDLLLIIQMQGAQITSSNDNKYGSGSAPNNGSGYLNNANLLAGNMEFVVANSSVPLTGGSLSLVFGTVNAYKNAAFGTDGQYTYQIIRVPSYNNATLTGTLTAPRWNGTSGGVIAMYATNDINLNNQTIDASGQGFRGGAGRAGFGGSPSYSNTDYTSKANVGAGANGSKGEGIAGTPKYSNNNYTIIDTTVGAVEGYPGVGSYARGAPGNAGGGGTDGNPNVANDQNTGGGGGGNAGPGGVGGNSWSTNLSTGGRPGAVFGQLTPKRMVMGGGGGAGTTNNGTGTPSGGLASGGAPGGGIIILYAVDKITGTGSILANGGNGNSTVQNDGAGGGGAGGSILLFSANGGMNNITASANGGNGGSNQTGGGAAHGPGGGGGGGVIYASSSLLSASAFGGTAGQTSGNTINYGAAGGTAGLYISNLTVSSINTVNSCVVLSVSFLDVKAQSSNGAVNLQWDVAYEVSTIGYSIERSTDGANFEAIGSTPYHSANDATDNQYQYTDNGAQTIGGTLYYRIHEIGSDGSSIYSRIVSVNLGTTSGRISVYPNPARNSASVSFPATTATTLGMRLFDLRGAQVWTLQYEAHPGMNTVQIDCIQRLPEGEYILQWFDKMSSQQVKILVHH